MHEELLKNQRYELEQDININDNPNILVTPNQSNKSMMEVRALFPTKIGEFLNNFVILLDNQIRKVYLFYLLREKDIYSTLQGILVKKQTYK